MSDIRIYMFGKIPTFVFYCVESTLDHVSIIIGKRMNLKDDVLAVKTMVFLDLNIK